MSNNPDRCVDVAWEADAWMQRAAGLRVSQNLFFASRAAIVARNSFQRQQAALARHFLTRTMLIAMTKDRRGMTR